MTTFVERLVTEYEDLQGKVAKLTAFTTIPMFSTLSQERQELLRVQLGHMEAYLEVLGCRVKLETHLQIC